MIATDVLPITKKLFLRTGSILDLTPLHERLGLLLCTVRDRSGHKRTRRLPGPMSALHPIVLQKSKIAGLQIFTKNLKRETIANSYNLNRATEVADEFNVGR